MRKKRYDKEFRAKVVHEVQNGMTYDEAVRKFGVSKASIANWKNAQSGLASRIRIMRTDPDVEALAMLLRLGKEEFREAGLKVMEKLIGNA